MSERTEVFFQEQKNWSHRKLEIIRKYLDGFVKILGSSGPGCVYYIDGFAGAGKYEDGSSGSPLLAAELAESYRDSQKIYRLYCINVEKDPSNFQNLQSETARFGLLVQNYLGTFINAVPQILARTDGCPAFFFIDDFGVKGTDWSAVKQIIGRKGPTDLWIRFDHKTVRRLDGFFDSSTTAAQSKYLKLKQLYGINNTDYLHQRLVGDTPEERINNALQLYIERLEQEFQQVNKGSGFAAGFPIYSLDNENKYHLVFAGAHARAAILASETVYSVERNRQREVNDYHLRVTGQPSLFSLDPTPEEIDADKVEHLKEIIWPALAGKRFTRDQIVLFVLRLDQKKCFGKFSSVHFTQAINELINDGNPKIIQKTGAPSKSDTEFTFRSI